MPLLPAKSVQVCRLMPPRFMFSIVTQGVCSGWSARMYSVSQCVSQMIIVVFLHLFLFFC